jgi:hypothetical protein
MAYRPTLLWMIGLTCVCLLGPLAGPTLHAQDRGAPRFGPAAPGDTIEAETSDAGRLWSLAAPPFDRFERRYEMEADSAWATHLRRGLLRLPNCTAALVSAEGLALTTARCVRRHLGPNASEEAVVAEQRADERSLSGLHADRLVGATDVTAEVQAARSDTSTQRAVRSVQQRLQSEAGPNQRVEMETAAGGARHTAYTYRRYEDVRVAFLPSRAVSAFGGIDAAMTYPPRAAFDVALLRVYTPDGTPLAADHFFEMTTQGVRPGDAVFAAGQSETTRRAESADQHATHRDLTLPTRQALLETWTQATRAYLDTADAAASHHDALRRAERALKRTRARLEALQNEYLMTRLQRRDAQFRRALRRDASLRNQFGGVLDSLAALQEAKWPLASAYRAFGRFGAASRLPAGSYTFRRILHARRQGAAGSASAAGGTTMGAPRADGDSVGRHPAPVETALLASRLKALRSHLRPDTAAVRRLLQGRSPTDCAAAIVENSVLATPSEASAGTATPVVPPDDPAAAVVDVVGPRARSFFEEWRPLTRAERRLTRRLARARQAVRTAPVRPGGENALRLTDGRVLGYPYNGTTAPPLTTFFGLYGQSHSFGEAEPWKLPDRWRRSTAELDRSVPLTLAASTDGAVGNNAAPLLNKYLELVGVTVGPNVQAAAGTYIFLPERMRTVAVDVRGLRQALTAVYEAERLIEELSGGASTPPE